LEHTAHALLAGWESYYVILGAAAAALTGLQFVVVALIADRPSEASPETMAAFGTPTVVHFCEALLISAILTAPWARLWSASLPLLASGLGGLGYALIVIRRARSQHKYQPVAEDWLWHVFLPLGSYVALTGAALGLSRHPVACLFTIGAVTLMLVFIGIHNAWDTVTYIATRRNPPAS
jgi:hypothetical protein